MAVPTTTTHALPAGGGERPRNILTLTSLALGSGGLMFFAALVGAYVHLRNRIEHFHPEEAHLDQYLGNMLVITLLLATVTAEWGHSAVRRGIRRQATTAYSITVGLGAAFLFLLWHTGVQAGYGPASHEYGLVVSTMAITLGIVVGLGVGFAALTLFRVLGGQVSAAEPDQARAAAWYWHFAAAAAVLVWYTVVVLK
ncbi:MAG TPA: cytochrome c oxidase subunit 3 [Acidimicrobiales bacterium]|nr:cytochrome c oxidase subunit 3 [Acidimicrobiales bacterium]